MLNLAAIKEKYKIDTTQEAFQQFPAVMNGQILLESNERGTVTIDEATFVAIYGDPLHDFVASGHEKYRQKFIAEGLVV
ncbi:MAG: hypothetical protein AB1553_00635 [Nitrospirota bacterium]